MSGNEPMTDDIVLRLQAMAKVSRDYWADDFGTSEDLEIADIADEAAAVIGRYREALARVTSIGEHINNLHPALELRFATKADMRAASDAIRALVQQEKANQ